jgi:pimeloyl-ACP methyl ester carboxylesterase
MSISFPEPKIVEANGVKLVTYEQGEGLPVLFAHGFPELAYSWRYQMAALAEAGHRVIAVDQRGYGDSDKPSDVAAYDVHELTADLCGVMDAYGIEKAVTVGHDWGAIINWQMPLLHPDRVLGIANLSVPFIPHGEKDLVSSLEELMGDDFYIVHFNKQPGVADAILDEHARNFIRNLYRKNHWKYTMPEPQPGLMFAHMARMDEPFADPLMSDEELKVFQDAFEKGGFTGPINWYRNLRRNWETTAHLEEKINTPALMIFGEHDVAPPSDLSPYAPQIESHTLKCGHWIQQEKPDEVNKILIDWLKKNF